MFRERERLVSDAGQGTKTKTIQSAARETDVNFIVKSYAQTGMWKHLDPREPIYGDFTQTGDLQSQYERVAEAEAAFAELPASVRSACENSPVKFLEMCAQRDQTWLLVEKGLPVTDDVRKDLAAEFAPPVVPDPEPNPPSGGETPPTD